MKCMNCGQDNPEQAKYCNYCGAMSQNSNKTEELQGTPVSGHYRIVTPSSQVSPDNPIYRQNEKPNATGQIIFSIVNIVCCGSMVLGIIALVFSLMASSENDLNEAKNKLKIAKILNIIGIVISVLIIILITTLSVFSFFLSNVEITNDSIVKSGVYGSFQ